MTKLGLLLVVGVIGVILTSVPLTVAQDEGAGSDTTTLGADATSGDEPKDGAAADSVADSKLGEPKVSGPAEPGDGKKLKCYACLFVPGNQVPGGSDENCKKGFDGGEVEGIPVSDCDGTLSKAGEAAIGILKLKGVELKIVDDGKPACIIGHVEHKDLPGGIFFRDCAKISESILKDKCLHKTDTDSFSGLGEAGWGCACNEDHCNGKRPKEGETPGPGPGGKPTNATTMPPASGTTDNSDPDGSSAIQASILLIMGAAILLVSVSTI